MDIKISEILEERQKMLIKIEELTMELENANLKIEIEKTKNKIALHRCAEYDDYVKELEAHIKKSYTIEDELQERITDLENQLAKEKAAKKVANDGAQKINNYPEVNFDDEEEDIDPGQFTDKKFGDFDEESKNISDDDKENTKKKLAPPRRSQRSGSSKRSLFTQASGVAKSNATQELSSPSLRRIRKSIVSAKLKKNEKGEDFVELNTSSELTECDSQIIKEKQFEKEKGVLKRFEDDDGPQKTNDRSQINFYNESEDDSDSEQFVVKPNKPRTEEEDELRFQEMIEMAGREERAKQELKRRRKAEASGEDPEIINAPNFEIKKAGRLIKELIIFVSSVDDDERKCYRMSYNLSKQNFICDNCASKGKNVIAKRAKNNGENVIKLEAKHICDSIEYE